MLASARGHGCRYACFARGDGNGLDIFLEREHPTHGCRQKGRQVALIVSVERQFIVKQKRVEWRPFGARSTNTLASVTDEIFKALKRRGFDCSCDLARSGRHLIANHELTCVDLHL
jgi:hypothetical protein